MPERKNMGKDDLIGAAAYKSLGESGMFGHSGEQLFGLHGRPLAHQAAAKEMLIGTGRLSCASRRSAKTRSASASARPIACSAVSP